jgi:hypothetical protein
MPDGILPGAVIIAARLLISPNHRKIKSRTDNAIRANTPIHP